MDTGLIGDIASVLTTFMVFYLVIQNFFLEKEMTKLKAIILPKTDGDDTPPPTSKPKPTTTSSQPVAAPAPIVTPPAMATPIVSHMPSPAKRPLRDVVESKVVEAFETITRSCKSEVSTDPSHPTRVIEKRWKIDGYVADNGMDQQLMDKEMEIFQKQFKSEMQGVGVIDSD